MRAHFLLPVAIGGWIVDNGNDERSLMKHFVALTVVCGLLFGWLVSAPPARACSPVPAQAWFVPHFEILSDKVSLEIQSVGWGQHNAYALRLRNLNLGVIYLIGSNQIKLPEPLEGTEYVPPPGFEVYLAVTQNEVEILDVALLTISYGLQDRNVYAEARPEIIDPPAPQKGVLWIVVNGDEILTPLVLTYETNPSFFATNSNACSDFYFIESLLAAIAYGLPIVLLVLLFFFLRKKTLK